MNYKNILCRKYPIGIFIYANISDKSNKCMIVTSMIEDFKNHIPLPPETPAFECTNCGAVSLNPNCVCKILSKIKKADWCGTKSIESPKQCRKYVNTKRYVCKNCGRVSMNSELLCKPKILIP